MRRIVVALCVVGVAGLIVTSILDVQGAAVTIGLCTATAVLCLIVATAVSEPERDAPFDEEQAAHVERLVTEMAARGADEAALRCLVREAVSLGRGENPKAKSQKADQEVWQQ